MIVSINQPAYLPWLGYFHRIATSDLHVVLDHVQFEKNSYCNRNKIRVGNEGCWLTVPVQTKGKFGELPISDLQFAENLSWQRKHWESLRMNYSSSPYFKEYSPAYEALYKETWPSFNPMCRAFLKQNLKDLEITTPIRFSSEMDIKGSKSDLVLFICQELGANTYLSGELGKNYLDEKTFHDVGIKVSYQKYMNPVYRQSREGFIPNLCILDLLFNHGPDSRRILLGDQIANQKKSHNIVIRTDASLQIGSGHVMRCLTMAEALKGEGSKVLFVCRNHPGNLNDLIRKKGFQVVELQAVDSIQKNDGAKTGREAYAAWLGVSQQKDAEETISVIGEAHSDWIIIDHYGLGEVWEKAVRPYASKIMTIDDLADRRHDCDLLLDQNFFLNGEKRYEELIAPSCTKLLGPKYVLLRKEFSEERKKLRERTGKVKRVFVFFGGSDVENITGIAIEALSVPEFLHLNVDVVIGAQNPHKGEIETLVRRRPLTKLHIQVDNMAELMSAADLAIGAGGSTTWERLYLGLPTIIIPLAENQISTSLALQQQGVIAVVGIDGGLTVKILKTAIRELLIDQDRLLNMSKQGAKMIPYDSVNNVSNFIKHGLDKAKLNVRKATVEDSKLYWYWVNDPDVRQNAFKSEPVLADDHQKWFNDKIADKNVELLVIDSHLGPVGQIRFELEDGFKKIDFSIARQFRGNNVGRIVIIKALEYYNEKENFMAEVKKSNVRSAAIFTGLGFNKKEMNDRYVFTI